MNSPTLEIPPTPPQQTGEPHFLVAVKVTVPFPVFGCLPLDNYIGTMLLSHAFIREFAALNILVKDKEVHCGALNDSYFVFTVTHDGRAVARMDSLLKTFRLRHFSSVLYLRHGLFRPYGMDGAKIGVGFTLERMMLALAKHQKEAEAIFRVTKALRDELVRRASKPIPTGPDAADPQNPDAPQ